MALNKKGMEMPDIRSLVAVCDLSPITLGDKIRRYVRTPTLADDLLYHDEKYDPDDFFDDEDRPMSPHEERAAAWLERKKERKTAYDKQVREKEIADQEAENEAFRERVKALKLDIPKTE